MTSFDEAKHKRDTAGRFTHKPHTEAEVSLTGVDPNRLPVTPARVNQLIATLGLDGWRAKEDGAPTDPTRLTLSTDTYEDKWVVDVKETETMGEYKLALADALDTYKGDATVGAVGDINEGYTTVAEQGRIADGLAHTYANAAHQLRGEPQTSRADALAQQLNEWTEAERTKLARLLTTTTEDNVEDNQGGGNTLRAASDPNTDPETLNELFTTGNPQIVGAIAANPNTPPATLVAIAFTHHPIHAQAAAANPNIHPAGLEAIATTDAVGWPAKRGVCANPNTPTRILAEVAAYDPPAALANPNMTGQVAAALTNEERAAMRSPIPNGRTGIYPPIHLGDTSGVTDPDVLLWVAKAKSPQTRVGAATNPNTPRKVVEDLTRDGNPDVEAAAQQALAARKQEH